MGAADLQPSPGLVLGCRIALRELRDGGDILPAARGDAAQGKARHERSLPEAGAAASAIGRSGGHAGDAATAHAVLEA